MHVWILANVSKSTPGGMRRHMELHAAGLRALGHRAELLFAEDIAAGTSFAVSPRLPGVHSFAALHRRYERDPPDLVNLHTECAPTWIAAKRVGFVSAKIVVMSYAADEASVRIRGPADVLRWGRAAVPARLAFPHADGIWCVNQQDLEYYVAEYGVSRTILRRFPHAVDDSFYTPRPAVRRERQVLFVGTWILRKGIDILVTALERVARSLPDLGILFAGTLVGEATVRSALPAALSQRTRVVDRAADDELAELYRSSALLLVPSRREGLPIGMLEAMACGCPPLAAANSGMLDVIESGVNGWLEASFDPDRWAARIEALFANPEGLARASLGAAATAQEFRVRRVAGDVAAWYETLLQR